MKNGTAQRDRVLLIGDSANGMRKALDEAMPGVEITVAPTVFDGLAELVAGRYSAVLANAEPIERRPEAAVRELRELAGDSRVVVFGGATLEPLARKMLDFGVDDYVVTPVGAGELGEVLRERKREVEKVEESGAVLRSALPRVEAKKAAATAPTGVTGLAAVPLADVVLDALLRQPGDAAGTVVRNLNEIIAPTFRAAYVAQGAAAPAAPGGMVRIAHPVRAGNEEAGEVQLFLPPNEEQGSALHFATHLASLMGKVVALQGRHTSLQKLAITDDMTGLYNGRYFRHFLTRILELARQKKFPVTLFTFDIDNFKQYNDKFGHKCGDEILKQTATLIKRCVREHDHVARIGGDEFAVVFWEKDAPRQPHHEGAGTPGRPPTDAGPILQRFQGMLASQDLTLLGAHGKGSLTISGGLAVYPWDASDIDGLIKAADEALMFGAKKEGKNSIALVGSGGNAGAGGGRAK